MKQNEFQILFPIGERISLGSAILSRAAVTVFLIPTKIPQKEHHLQLLQSNFEG